MQNRNSLWTFLSGLRPTKTVAMGLAAAALFTIAACERTTGVTQLPMPPDRDVVSFNAPAPTNGPPFQPNADCKLGRGDYRLGPGDKIRVVVLQDTEFSGDYEVNATGAISARMIGPVQVAGMTLNEVEEMLREKYRSGGYLVSPRLSVELVTTRPFFIIGEVQRSGAFAYVNCLRVIQAVAIAGGFTRRASKSHITIKRYYSKSAEEEYVTEDTLVEPGDLIRIPERYF
ncbi:polysaccharide biosynthesis/export family protein [Enhydrobacter aerosaccus]|uniref:polysaccharide biosynthesis/export family protein n=1 Tax=Enhydrobacter aerosaccus TaxID=225324 RepID=UPI001117611A|nr:polysaccharide biosynthesis/export family protein [Enhydrobacter aerosaccus]